MLWSASVKTLLSDAASTAALISALVWSAVADASIPSSFVPSADTSLPSTVPLVTMFCEPKLGLIFVPAIAAEALTSALTIVPSAILADVTCPSPKSAVLIV